MTGCQGAQYDAPQSTTLADKLNTAYRAASIFDSGFGSVTKMDARRVDAILAAECLTR